jgi:hypothetical protein
MSANRQDEFYVGYLPRAPQGIARRSRLFVVGALLVGLGAAVALVASHGPFGPGVFEFGNTRAFEGVVRLVPYPALELARPGAGEKSTSAYLLVAPGKFGAGEIMGGFAGQRVSLEGTLVYRDERTMIEVVPGSVQRLGWEAAEPPPVEKLGRLTLRGEIVDSKCFLGVMNPGNLKTHRACATLCISGGIPPVLLVRERGGAARYLVLVSPEGRPVNEELLPFVAEPIEIEGELERHGDLELFRIDPGDIERL